jgi:hypothetical protein
VSADLAQAREFLEVIFTGVPGLIELRAIEVDGPAHAVFCDNINAAVDAVEKLALPDVNLYVAVATRRTKDSGKKENLRAVSAFWTDIDFKSDPQGERELLEIKLESFPLPPSLKVSSGGGAHLYWILRDAIELSAADTIARIENINKGLADQFGGDHCWNADRIMRIPGTTNWPTAKKRERGRLAPRECRLA